MEPAPGAPSKTKSEGWVFYDNKWNNGSAQDGWGKYTRRRKWCRDAELVDAQDKRKEKGTPPEITVSNGAASRTDLAPKTSTAAKIDSPLKPPATARTTDGPETASTVSKRRGFFSSRRESKASAESSVKSSRSVRTDEDEDQETPTQRSDGDFVYNDDMKMGLG